MVWTVDTTIPALAGAWIDRTELMYYRARSAWVILCTGPDRVDHFDPRIGKALGIYSGFPLRSFFWTVPYCGSLLVYYQSEVRLTA